MWTAVYARTCFAQRMLRQVKMHTELSSSKMCLSGWCLLFCSDFFWGKKMAKNLSKIKVTSRQDKGLFKSNYPERSRTHYQYCNNSSKKNWMFLISMFNTSTAGMKVHILVTLKPGELAWWSDWGFFMHFIEFSAVILTKASQVVPRKQ